MSPAPWALDPLSTSDAPASDPVPARPHRIGLFAVMGGVLALALLAVAVVQARQYLLLKQTVVSQDDYAVLSLYQMEGEYLRLREQWARARHQGESFDRDALQLRYDIWVSRVGLLHSQRAIRLMVGGADYEAPLRQVHDFVEDADRMLAEPRSMPFDAAGLAEFEPGLHGLNEPIHSMSLSAAHHVAEQITQRNQTVRRHNQIGLVLTGFLSLLVLAFGVMAMRQLRLLNERQRSLVDLTAHLREARQQAEAASEAKSVFLANMSHEIRTPFHGLLGMLSLLRDTGLNARQVDCLRTATESADHLLTILNDILDMSLLESGRMALSEEPVKLRDLLREVEALMRPQAQFKSLALHIDADPGVPEQVRADRTRVKQILFNLLHNAVKFSDRGVVVLDLRCVIAADGSERLEFVVTDTGVGMDQATLDRLFKRFSQGDESRSRRHGGTGLGLEISRSLARLMGGDVVAQSAPGEGSSFNFYMPLRAVEAPTPKPVGRPVAATGSADLAQLHVLVAEDHPVNRQYMAALLEGMGHKPYFAGNGLEAVQAIRGQRFDIVLMDLHMPLLDGVGATLSIRALSDNVAATVPIIALTADAFAQTRERCLIAGMNDFLAKPVSPEKLSATLRRLFGAGGRAAAVPTAPLDVGPPEASPPVLDRATLDAALHAMSPERLSDLLADFFAQGPEMVERLRLALRDGQALDLRVNAHAARGAALNFGLNALAQTAQALHEGATHVPAHEIARLIQHFDDLLARSREACEEAGLLEPVVN